MEDLPAVLVRLSRFLARPIVRHEVPGRADVAAIDGRWVRERSDWRGKIGHKDMRLFHAMNGEVLTSLGYVPDGADPPVAAGRVGPGRGRPLALENALVGIELWCTARYWRLRRRLRRSLARRPMALAAARKPARGVHRR